MAKNPFKIAKKYIKTQLKSYLIEFHDFPEEKYVSEFLDIFFKVCINILEEIIKMGLFAYLFLYGLSFVFGLSKFIYLGLNFLDSIRAILLLGLIVVSIKEIYKWKRGLM